MLCRSTSKIIPIRIHWAKQLPYNETLSLKAEELAVRLLLKKGTKNREELIKIPLCFFCIEEIGSSWVWY